MLRFERALFMNMTRNYLISPTIHNFEKSKTFDIDSYFSDVINYKRISYINAILI